MCPVAHRYCGKRSYRSVLQSLWLGPAVQVEQVEEVEQVAGLWIGLVWGQREILSCFLICISMAHSIYDKDIRQEGSVQGRSKTRNKRKATKLYLPCYGVVYF